MSTTPSRSTRAAILLLFLVAAVGAAMFVVPGRWKAAILAAIEKSLDDKNWQVTQVFVWGLHSEQNTLRLLKRVAPDLALEPTVVLPLLAPFQAVRERDGNLPASDDGGDASRSRGEAIARILPDLAAYIETTLEAALPALREGPLPGSGPVRLDTPMGDLDLFREAVTTTLALAAHREAQGDAGTAMRLRLAALKLALAQCRRALVGPGVLLEHLYGVASTDLAAKSIGAQLARGKASIDDRILRGIAPELARLAPLLPPLSAPLGRERDWALGTAAELREHPERALERFGLPIEKSQAGALTTRVADRFEGEVVAFWNDVIPQVDRPHAELAPLLRRVDAFVAEKAAGPGLTSLLDPVGVMSGVLMAVSVPTFGRASVRHCRASARLRGAALFARLEIRRRETGAWPRALEDLGPDLPRDPFTGGPFLYARDDRGGLRLAAVGENGRDDHGTRDGDDLVVAEIP